MTFEQRVLQFISKNSLMAPRDRVLVGVSGGADSMALLSVLAHLRHELGMVLYAAHFNHRLRPEAGQDEIFTADWCEKLNVPLITGRRQGGKISHLSEDDARQMRFEFFVQTAQRLKTRAVALAHTRNDLAETVLMRLMRGSGLYGLRAILPRRFLEGVIFVRPLLAVHRRDVEVYLKSQKVPYCTDVTNSRVLYERNKVRLRLLPLLAREYNPQIINTLSDLAQTAGEDYEFLSSFARAQFDKIVRVSTQKVKCDLKSIRRQHPAILRLLIRQMAEHFTKDPAAFSFEHIQSMEKLIAQDKQGRIDLPHQLQAAKTKDFFELKLSKYP